MGALLYICCMFSEDLFIRTPLEGYFSSLQVSLNLQGVFFIKLFKFCKYSSGWRGIKEFCQSHVTLVGWYHQYFSNLKRLSYIVIIKLAERDWKSFFRAIWFYSEGVISTPQISINLIRVTLWSYLSKFGDLICDLLNFITITLVEKGVITFCQSHVILQ